ncbi:hypothetical protein CN373_17740 [Bacillus cereus]|uniref:Uncharacterized protein n=1 Tax=Bacillus cereus TaxID=1396 RepID=A0AA44Q5S2_BACCE|nr:hypothetical protein CN373_17740 [Bacillus cereus]PFN07154.1 hypothetical protein COJ55_11605 [Bacillus cereus]PFO82039.1 hypothetical protein COJ77_14765 [Bacillus cereus]PFR24557.1 hypothetical protein COK19_17900 [Bacillus cereus]PFR89064.1 hypothetical protein COK38_25030 [Bacillus cereus]
MFQQNSTTYIVTSFGFQFGYIFVTVMLQRDKEQEKTIIYSFFLPIKDSSPTTLYQSIMFYKYYLYKLIL